MTPGKSVDANDRPRPHDRRWAREYEMWRHQYLTMNFILIGVAAPGGAVGVLTLDPLYMVIGALVVALAVWRAYAVYSLEKELRWVRNG